MDRKSECRGGMDAKEWPMDRKSECRGDMDAKESEVTEVRDAKNAINSY